MKSVVVRAENVQVGDIIDGRRVQGVFVGKGRNGANVGLVTRHPKNMIFETINVDGKVRVSRPKKNYQKPTKRTVRVEVVEAVKQPTWRDNFGPKQLAVIDALEANIKNMSTEWDAYLYDVNDGKYSFNGIIVSTAVANGVGVTVEQNQRYREYDRHAYYTSPDIIDALGGTQKLEELLDNVGDARNLGPQYFDGIIKLIKHNDGLFINKV